VRSVFDANVTEPTAYDLVINVARTTPAAMVQMLTPLIHVRTVVAATARVHLSPQTERNKVPTTV
jgi:hypothetical protein